MSVIRLGFFTGGGAENVGDLHRMISLSATSIWGTTGYSITNLSDAAVQRLSRAEYDAVIFPGGGGTSQSNAIGSTGRAAVRSFVKAGGGYIGTCGGAFLGIQHLYFYGEPAPKTEGYPDACHAHGCNVTIGFSPSACRTFDLGFGTEHNVTSMYHNGPLAKHFPSNVTVFARFRAQGAPWAINNNNSLQWSINASTPAITGTAYGEGRVVLNSPHPEHMPSVTDSAKIYEGELRWVIQEQIPQLTQEQIPQLTQEQIRELTQEQIRELTQEQIPQLTQEQIPQLTQEQIPQLTQEQIREPPISKNEGDAVDAVDARGVRGVHGVRGVRGVRDDMAAVLEQVLGTFYPTSKRLLQKVCASADASTATLQPDGTWKDVKYNDTSRSTWLTMLHLDRIQTMGTALTANGSNGSSNGSSAYLHNASATKEATLLALDWWLAHNPQNPNWW
jgi:glutamine amidotransferase-like uncharacterized protein